MEKHDVNVPLLFAAATALMAGFGFVHVGFGDPRSGTAALTISIWGFMAALASRIVRREVLEG